MAFYRPWTAWPLLSGLLSSRLDQGSQRFERFGRFKERMLQGHDVVNTVNSIGPTADSPGAVALHRVACRR